MSRHATSLKTLSFCMTLFYLSVVCVKTFFPFDIFPVWVPIWCATEWQVLKNQGPQVFHLIPSGRKPLGRETRASPPFGPSQRRRANRAALALPPAVDPWSAMEDERWPPCPWGRCSSDATALHLQRNGQREQWRNICTDPPVSAF